MQKKQFSGSVNSNEARISSCLPHGSPWFLPRRGAMPPVCDPAGAKQANASHEEKLLRFLG